MVATVDTVKRAGSLSPDAIVAAATATATKEANGLVLNTASRFAVERAEKQLAFFKDNAEIQRVTDALGETDLVRKAIPSLPIALPKL